MEITITSQKNPFNDFADYWVAEYNGIRAAGNTPEYALGNLILEVFPNDRKNGIVNLEIPSSFFKDK